MIKTYSRVLSLVIVLAVFTGLLRMQSTAQAGSPTGATAAQTPPAASSQTPVGPDTFPAGVNPLTGLPVEDASLLSLPPALISVSNFPVSARPQAGLSYSPYVFEMYIGKGMTRYLAMFYGAYPQTPISSTVQANMATDNAAIGPIRSGRLPYQSIRNLYNGFLVMASASSEVRTRLAGSTNIYGSDHDNINSALINVDKLQTLAQANASGKPANLTGNAFNPAPAQGGQNASRLLVFYNFYNQVLWTYDPASQAYLRSQDKADGSGKFYPSTDRLTGDQLAFENVIVLYAKHTPLNGEKTLIDLDLFFTQNKAYLFRDGQAYPIQWTTVSGDYEKKTGLMRPIRFVDSQGKPFALKPGKTWVEIVDITTTLAGNSSGDWKARFYAP